MPVNYCILSGESNYSDFFRCCIFTGANEHSPGIASVANRCFTSYHLVWMIKSSLCSPGRDKSKPQSYVNSPALS